MRWLAVNPNKGVARDRPLIEGWLAPFFFWFFIFYPLFFFFFQRNFI
jgi:hypothetical protein